MYNVAVEHAGNVAVQVDLKFLTATVEVRPDEFLGIRISDIVRITEVPPFSPVLHCLALKIG